MQYSSIVLRTSFSALFCNLYVVGHKSVQTHDMITLQRGETVCEEMLENAHLLIGPTNVNQDLPCVCVDSVMSDKYDCSNFVECYFQGR